MLNEIVKNTTRFFLFVLLQVLIIKNIGLGQFINPFVYILFIIMLPFDTPKPLLLLLAFITGLTIDMFYDTLGLHAAACVFTAFVRPNIYRIFSPREGYESGQQPTLRYMGFAWFVSAGGLLIIVHHLFLFYVEVFRFSEFFYTFLRVLLSSIFSFGFCLMIQYLLFKRKTNE